VSAERYPELIGGPGTAFVPVKGVVLIVR